MTFDELMGLESTYELIKHKYPFEPKGPEETDNSRNYRAREDVRILMAWEKGNMLAKDARIAMADNNGWSEVPSMYEFKAIAASLGYFKGEVPKSRRYGGDFND